MTEQMTLAQVRDGLRAMKTYPHSLFSKWADAIDAHLNAAKGEVDFDTTYHGVMIRKMAEMLSNNEWADLFTGDDAIAALQEQISRLVANKNATKGEVVAWWCAIESVEDIDGTEEIAMSWNVDDGNNGEAARTEANQWINDQPHPGSFRLARVYTHPASPDVVRDAMQFVPDEAKPELCAPISHEWLAKVTGHREGWNACRKEMLKRIDAAKAARDGGE